MHASPRPSPRTTPRTAPTGPGDSVGWVFVAHPEVGLLHRLRRVVRGSRALVLVHLDAGTVLPFRAQVGVGLQEAPSAPTRVLCFGRLGATEVAALLTWLAGPAPDLATAPAGLHHRIAVGQAAGAPRAVSGTRGAGQRRP
ncbi:hypothetical protein [Kineococcus esterisolvens]|uniref:hypothetical protein n=1 Tax=unclassified Kineococcus TaxID=2621656 RepID=UPI003D7ECF04